jgi:hypothetical protein
MRLQDCSVFAKLYRWYKSPNLVMEFNEGTQTSTDALIYGTKEYNEMMLSFQGHTLCRRWPQVLASTTHSARPRPFIFCK